MKIDLTVQEALEYQKADAELNGFMAGVASAVEYMKRKKLQEIVQSRKPTEEAT